MIGLGGINGKSYSWKIRYDYTEKGRDYSAVHIVSAKNAKEAAKLGLDQILLEHPKGQDFFLETPKRVR